MTSELRRKRAYVSEKYIANEIFNPVGQQADESEVNSE